MSLAQVKLDPPPGTDWHPFAEGAFLIWHLYELELRPVKPACGMPARGHLSVGPSDECLVCLRRQLKTPQAQELLR
jgi:hypothetical protein